MNAGDIRDSSYVGSGSWVGKIPWRRKWQCTPNTLAWRIPWTEEPGGLLSTGSQRVRHDWATSCHVMYGKAEEKARKRGRERPRAASVQQSPRCDQRPHISKAPSPQLIPKSPPGRQPGQIDEETEVKAFWILFPLLIVSKVHVALKFFHSFVDTPFSTSCKFFCLAGALPSPLPEEMVG